MANVRKPWLTSSQQVAHLKSEGVGFRICSERDAEEYLKGNNNNYFRLKSYRANFARVVRTTASTSASISACSRTSRSST